VSEKFVLDACAMIAFLNDEEGAQKVEQLLSQGDRTPNTLFIHEINLLEIYYGVYRDENKELAEQTYVKVVNLPIKVVTGLRKNVFKEAGRLKAIYKISLADSIALAEARIRRIPLVTCDHHEFDPIQDRNELDFFWIR
jgi:PIN domain nuclease of toxin-antitoxin system